MTANGEIRACNGWKVSCCIPAISAARGFTAAVVSVNAAGKNNRKEDGKNDTSEQESMGFE